MDKGESGVTEEKEKRPHKVVVKVNEHGFGSVIVDGVELHANEVHVCIHAGKRNQVAINLVNAEIFIEVGGDVVALAAVVNEKNERPIFPVLLPPFHGGKH